VSPAENLVKRLICFASPIVGLAVGYAGATLQTKFAPVGLFPLLVGAAVGIGVAILLRVGEAARARAFVAAATVGVLLCGATIHYLSYVQARVAADAEYAEYQRVLHAFQQMNVGTPPTPLDSFGEYVRSELRDGRPLGPIHITGSALVLWWTIDALLLWVGAMVAALLLREKPATEAAASSSVQSTADAPSTPDTGKTT